MKPSLLIIVVGLFVVGCAGRKSDLPPIPIVAFPKSVTLVAASIVKADAAHVEWSLNVANFPVDGFRIRSTCGPLQRAVWTGDVRSHQYSPPLEPGLWTIDVTYISTGGVWSAPSEPFLVLVGKRYFELDAGPTPAGPWTLIGSHVVTNASPTQQFFRWRLVDK